MARKNRTDRQTAKLERQKAAMGDTLSPRSSLMNTSRDNAPDSRTIKKTMTTPPDIEALSDLAADSFRARVASAGLPRPKRTISKEPTPPPSPSGGKPTPRAMRKSSERGAALSSDAPSINDGASSTPHRRPGVVSSAAQPSLRRSNTPSASDTPTKNLAPTARSKPTATAPKASPRSAVVPPVMGTGWREPPPAPSLQVPVTKEAIDKKPDSPPKCKKRPDSREARKGPGGSRAFIPWCKK